jgi:hypothetical protein
MSKKGLVEATHSTCDHNDRLYTERCFDILNGLELKFTRCIDCHKIMELEAKKFTTN